MTVERSQLKAAIDQAWELLADYGAMNKAADTVAQEVASVRQALKDRYEAEVAAENTRLKEAQDAAKAAYQALLAHQAQVNKEYGITIELQGLPSSRHVRL